MGKIGTREERIVQLGNEIRGCLRDIELADETKKKAKDRIKGLEVEIRSIVKEEEATAKGIKLTALLLATKITELERKGGLDMWDEIITYLKQREVGKNNMKYDQLLGVRAALVERVDAAKPFTSGDVVDELMSTIPLMERLEEAIERVESLIRDEGTE